MIYETNKYAYNFQQLENIRSFNYSIFFNGKITLDQADKKQNNLLNIILELNSRTEPKAKADKKKKKDTNGTLNALYGISS